MDDLDALLADLESTTSHISKHPALLAEETPYSCPTGGKTGLEAPEPPPAEALNGTLPDPPDSRHSSQQSFASAQKGSRSRDSGSPPAAHIEEDHVYSFPNKQKSSEASGAMSSALGSNLSELDRLLLELNAVQQSTPSFPTTEEAPPPLPSCGTTHYVQENGCSPAVKTAPPPTEKAKRNGSRGIEDVRPSVESLLDELESSVPTPTPAPSAGPRELSDGHLDTPAEQQTRISASSATRELDELMACLSDFKPGSLGSLNSEPLPDQGANTPSLAFDPLPVPSGPSPGPSPGSAHQPTCDSPLTVPAVSLELLHIEEEGVDIDGSGPSRASVDLRPGLPVSPSLTSQHPTARELDSKTIVDVSPSMLSTRLESLVVFSDTSLSADHPKCGSVSAEPTSLPLNSSAPSSSMNVVTLSSREPSCLPVSSTTSSAAPAVPPVSDSAARSPAPSLISSSTSPPRLGQSPALQSSASSSKVSSPVCGPAAPSCAPPSPAATKSSTPPPIPTFTLPPGPAPAPTPEGRSESLEDALDKLLAMSFSGLESPAEPMVREPLQEVSEAPVLVVNRMDAQPDTYAGTGRAAGWLREMTAASASEKEIGQSDVSDWAEPWARGLCEGLDGTASPVTESSWTDDSPVSSPCPPGTPDAQLDLPRLQPSAVERVSASGHIKSVIRRTKETSNVHPMYREGHPRRKLGPIIFNKNSSQDRLIEELQGKLGIGRAERRPRRQDDWLTEGVIITSRPQRTREDGPGVEVDKVEGRQFAAPYGTLVTVCSSTLWTVAGTVQQTTTTGGSLSFTSSLFCPPSCPLFHFVSPLSHPFPQIIIPPESPVPQRKVFPPPQFPPTRQSRSPVEEPKRPPPVKQAPPLVHQAPPPAPPPLPTPPAPPPQPPVPSPPQNPPSIGKPPNPQKHPTSTYIHRAVGTVSSIPVTPPLSSPVKPARPPSPKVLVSIGIQTEEDPLFPPMQAWDSLPPYSLWGVNLTASVSSWCETHVQCAVFAVWCPLLVHLLIAGCIH
ncbi:flocculation protein FLO11 isoform X1 [Scleropages formosus]|uniref:flocculation protein FLO11 isoform X1 n=1 Tax=Scleropages formosus TaxID=113540 RepID=UPI0010FAAA91|nr:paxillin isoform X1 [Scleropages formosus]